MRYESDLISRTSIISVHDRHFDRCSLDFGIAFFTLNGSCAGSFRAYFFGYFRQ